MCAISLTLFFQDFCFNLRYFCLINERDVIAMLTEKPLALWKGEQTMKYYELLCKYMNKAFTINIQPIEYIAFNCPFRTV